MFAHSFIDIGKAAMKAVTLKRESRGESETCLSASLHYVHLDLFRSHPSNCNIHTSAGFSYRITDQFGSRYIYIYTRD